MASHPWGSLGAYHDGQLAAERRAQVHAHLRECPICRAELAELAGLHVRLQDFQAPPPARDPQAFVRELLDRLPEPAPAEKNRRRLWGWALAPAVLVLGYALLQVLALAASLGLEAPSAVVGALDPYLQLLSWRSPLELLLNWLLADFAARSWLYGWIGSLLRFGYQAVWLAAMLGAALWVWAAAWWLYRRSHPELAHNPARRG